MPTPNNDNEYLGKLRDYYAEHRVLPSYASACDLLGFQSKQAFSKLVSRLKEAGFLQDAPDRRLAPSDRFFERLLADFRVPAGAALPTAEADSSYFMVDQYLVENPSTTVFVPVKGDSMMDAGILDGDIVVVDRRLAAKRGDYVVAIVDEQLTLKELDMERGKPILKPHNKAFATIRPQSTLEIYGVYVGLVRKRRR